MSVLNNSNAPVLTEAQRRARQAKASVAQIAEQLIRQWNQGWDVIWSSKDPASVLAEIGTDAGEIFQLNDDLITFLTTALAGKRQDDLDAIMAKVAAKPATTVAQDGTVTID